MNLKIAWEIIFIVFFSISALESIQITDGVWLDSNEDGKYVLTLKSTQLDYIGEKNEF